MASLPYILVCAGEDSGDSLGALLVREAVLQNFKIVGSGGLRMQTAGMDPLVKFDVLPVSGFGDVLPKYFELRKSFATLKRALESSDCLGLVAIDYPGFNMKLVKLAGKLRKPALYIAPPQVWAWKSRRAKVLARNPLAKLAVFFDFEEKVYAEAGCDVVRVQHPYVKTKNNFSSPTRQILLLPGSRKSQALRNLPLFLKAVQMARQSMVISRMDVVLLAARQELVEDFEKALRQFGDDVLLQKIRVVVTPQNMDERKAFYHSATLALSAPGTATLELALSGCPMVVCTKPDVLTYGLARLFVRTKYFALPNIILDKLIYPEIIAAPGKERWAVASIAQEIATQCVSMRNSDTDNLYSKLAVGKPLESLAPEFFRQLV